MEYQRRTRNAYGKETVTINSPDRPIGGVYDFLDTFQKKCYTNSMNTSKHTTIYRSIVAIVCIVVFLAMQILAWSVFTVRYDVAFGYTDEEEVVLFENQEQGGYIYGPLTQYLSFGGETQPVQAMANVGYRFLTWLEDDYPEARRQDPLQPFFKRTAVFGYDYHEFPFLIVNSDASELSTDAISADVYTYDGAPQETRSATICISDDSMEKKSYSLTFSEQVSLLGFAATEQWHLYSAYYDMSLLRDLLSLKIAKLLGFSYVADVELVNLMFNGEFVGLYLLSQGPVSSDVPMIEYCDAAHFNGTGFTISGSVYGIPDQYFNCPQSGETGVWEEALKSVYDALTSKSYAKVSALLDVDSAVNAYILQEIAKNPYVGQQDSYLTLNEGKLAFTSPWNFSLSYGEDISNIGIGMQYYEDIVMGTSYWPTSPHYLFVLLWKCDWFRSLVSERWQELYATDEFSSLTEWIGNCADTNRADFERNTYRFPLFGLEEPIWNAFYPPITNYISQEQHADWLQEWFSSRVKTLNEHWGNLNVA